MRHALDRVGIPEHVALAYDAWGPIGEDGKIPDDCRAKWLAGVADISVDADYASSFEQWKASFAGDGVRLAEFKLASRLLIGHGNSSATDIGLTVHHTWGVPVIPGSALKGLVAHYVDATYGPSDPDRMPWQQQGNERERANYQGVTWKGKRIESGPGAVYRALFGAPDAGKDEEMREQGLEAGAAAGLVTFHDALYVPPDRKVGNKPFAPDVLTVHQKGYYDSSGKNPPNDYDNPNPVGFLTVRPNCCLQLALSGPGDWTELACRLLTDALEKWGVGGKTSAGYGTGTVGAWTRPEPRLSKVEQKISELLKHGEDALRGGIEAWLHGGSVGGPMQEILSAAPDATTGERLEIVRSLVIRFKWRDGWSKRLKNKKADEQKKARTRALIEAWDGLTPPDAGA